MAYRSTSRYIGLPIACQRPFARVTVLPEASMSWASKPFQFARALAFATVTSVAYCSWAPPTHKQVRQARIRCQEAPRGMRLYYSIGSSASLRVLLVLRCKCIPTSDVHLVSVEGGTGSNGEAFWRMPIDDPETQRLGTRNFFSFNPEGRVPVLLIGKTKLTQSAAISSFIEDVFEGGGIVALLPKDALSRARVLQVVNIVQCDTHPLQNIGLLTNAIRDFGMPGKPARNHPFSLYFIRRGLVGLEAVIQETSGRFSVGDELTLADIYLVPQLRNALNAGVDVANEFPGLNRIWMNCLECPHIRTTLEEFGGIPQAPAAIDQLRIQSKCQ